MLVRALLPIAAALAALSLLGPSQPGYDPWAWLLWGRELAGGGLSTVDGPAWKPGPVLVTTPASLLGSDVAPVVWLWVARTGALLAIGLAGRLAWRLAPGGRPVAAVVGGLVVALSAGWPAHWAVGDSEGLLLALVLLAVGRGLDGDHRAALALGVAAALVRVEVWPLMALYGLWRWRTGAAGERAWLAAAAVAVPALWFLPELAGSGDLLRSGTRARIPNPGQPATAEVPLLASLEAALRIPFWPLAALAFAAPRGAARATALAGVAWIALVAFMAQAGFSGEPRYALPGAALLGVAAGAGAGRLGTTWHTKHTPEVRNVTRIALIALVATAIALLPARLADHDGELDRAADQAELAASLPDAIDDAGGAAALRRCGRPGTGRFRGPLVAYALDLPRTRVLTPDTTGATLLLRSRIRRTAPVQPPARGTPIARSARWELRVDGGPCARR